MITLITNSVTVYFKNKDNEHGLTYNQIKRLMDVRSYYHRYYYDNKDYFNTKRINKRASAYLKLSKHIISEEECKSMLDNIDKEYSKSMEELRNNHVSGDDADFIDLRLCNYGNYSGWFSISDTNRIGKPSNVIDLINGINSIVGENKLDFVIAYTEHLNNKEYTLEEFKETFINLK